MFFVSHQWSRIPFYPFVCRPQRHIFITFYICVATCLLSHGSLSCEYNLASSRYHSNVVLILVLDRSYTCVRFYEQVAKYLGHSACVNFFFLLFKYKIAEIVRTRGLYISCVKGAKSPSRVASALLYFQISTNECHPISTFPLSEKII